MTSPTYKVFIDWDSDGGLSVGDFEYGLGSWSESTFGTDRPQLSRSTVRAYHGSASLLVEWAGGATELAQFAAMGSFVVGKSYTFTAMVWVPSTGGRHVTATLAGIGFGTTSSVTDQWTKVSITFTATATTHLLQLWTSGAAVAGERTWVDYAQVYLAGEEITGMSPGVVSEISIQYGRDQARSLQPMGPGTVSFSVDNVSRDLSPENTSSPLANVLGPGRDLLVEAHYNNRCYVLFSGSLDDFTVDSSTGKWLASFSGIDAMARFKGRPISTPMYPALRTGAAVHAVLDALGWTGGRDIDPGGSTIRWWWAESDDAHQVLQDILSVEGPNALLHVGPSGEVVFRDRHHRLLRASSTTSQATFTNAVAVSPVVEHDPPFLVDSGWRDMINHVEVPITDREPTMEPVEIWRNDVAFSAAVGSSVQFTITTDEPFYNLQPATQGTPASLVAEDPELSLTAWRPDVIRTGGPVTVTYSRTSGQSTLVTVTASSLAAVSSIRLRAHKVETGNGGQKVIREDAASVTAMRGVRNYAPSIPWVGSHDAEAIADLVLGQRATRLPTITFDVVNGNADQLMQILSRDISDRITAIDSESGVNGDFFIESIKHSITDDGNTHRVTFACEKVRTPPTGLFYFDVAGAGFNDGKFAPTGMDSSANLFVFDQVGHGFNDGLFAT